MIKIPIKIKKTDRSLAGQEIKKQIFLTKPKIKLFSHSWLIFFIVGLIIVILIGLLVVLSTKESFPLIRIIPDQASFAWLKIDDLLFLENYFSEKLISKIDNFLKQNNLDLEKDIKPIYQEKIALILLPNKNQLNFVILAERKKDQKEKEEELLSKFEKELKKDFNFSQTLYRQIKITILKPAFFSSSVNYYYSQTQNYLIISNSEFWLEKIIDQIID